MTRQEFLEQLKTSLQGEVSAQVLQENLRYYDDYIASEARNGRAESEVIDEIGDPRLIARTIIDTTAGSKSVFESYEETDTGYGQGRSGYSRDSSGSSIHFYDFSKWYVKLAAAVIVMLIVIMLLAIIGGLLSLLIPMLPIIGMIILIIWFTQRRQR